MSAQLLGANASLNAPGGKPGAAPTVLQGALVVGGGTTVVGNEFVNGTLTVIQPAGGGTRTAYFTDGNVGVAENSLGIFTDQTSTTFEFKDGGVSGVMTFEGTAQGNTGEFGFNKPTRFTSSLYGNGTVGGVTIGNATPAGATSLNVFCPGGGGVRALYVTDGEATTAENSVAAFLNQGNTFLELKDSGASGILSYDGTSNTYGMKNGQAGNSASNLDLGPFSVITASQIAPASTGNFNIGSPAVPVSLILNTVSAGGGATCFEITDNGTGVGLNRIIFQLNQNNQTKILFTDSGVDAGLLFDGVTNRFEVDKPLQLPAVQAGRASSIASGTLIPVAGMVATSIVVVSQVQVVGETDKQYVIESVIVPQPGFVIVWGGGGNATFNWFVPQL